MIAILNNNGHFTDFVYMFNCRSNKRIKGLAIFVKPFFFFALTYCYPFMPNCIEKYFEWKIKNRLRTG